MSHSGTAVIGNFNVRGTAFSQEARAWVALEEGGEGVPAVTGTVSPCDVNAFTTGYTEQQGRGSQLDAFLRCGMVDPSAVSANRDDSLMTWTGEGAEDAHFALYLHCRGQASVVGLKEATDLKIGPLEFEIATFSAVRRLDGVLKREGSGDGGDRPDEAVLWAPIGLTHMFNSSAAVVRQEVLTDGDQHGAEGVGRLAVWLKGSGRFLALSSRRPSSATIDSGRQSLVAGGQHEVEGSTPLDFSFCELTEEEGSADAKMELLDLVIPPPWDGQPRCLLFAWE